jgi:hypothetical protein
MFEGQKSELNDFKNGEAAIPTEANFILSQFNMIFVT